MENHHFDPILLSMNISCCERCRKILKKKLLNMHGVDSVSIDMEKDVVIVTGTVDPMTLLNKVAKLGKQVKLLPNNGEHKHTRHQESQCGGGGPHGMKAEQEPHRCEPYEPPMVDERVCRDFHCKIHPRSRSITDKGSFFGGWPFYGGGGGFGGFGPYMNRGGFGGFGPYMNPMYEMMPPYFGGYHQPPPHYWCHRPRPFSSFY